MAFIPAPGVAQIRVTGTIGPEPWAVVLHWYSGTAAAWTQSQVQALADGVHSHWQTNLVPLFANDVHYKLTETVDLTDTTERSGTVPPVDIAGGTPGTAPTLAACILISHMIGSRYRGGHPRTYLPPSNAGNSGDGDTWSAGFVTTVDTDWKAFITGVGTAMQAAGQATNTQCCPRYTYNYAPDNVKHKFVKTRNTYLGPFPVQRSVVRNQIATQRRRLGM